jgi:N-methylhydantoinase B/oxoprolinase/acetone carboxylase alpha subunit
LSTVLPTKTTAGNSAHMHGNSYAGVNPETGEYWIYIEINEGSYGGRNGKDGLDGVDNLVANTRNNPIEELEMKMPMRCHRYELREEEPAGGQWRGGIGIVREWEFFTNTLFTGEGDRHYDPPKGVYEGQEGLTGSLILNRKSNDGKSFPAKVTNYKINAGDRLQIKTPSAGGYGNPLDRIPEKVLEDVFDEFISIETAMNIYGVVLDEKLGLDILATNELRKNKRKDKVKA